MNKPEKQVIKFQLDKEQAAINDLERQYKQALKDIEEKIKLLQSDELTQSRVYQIQYQKALKGQVEGILDKLHGDEYATIQQYLHDSYQDGFIGTMYSIHGQGIPLIVPIDQKAAVEAVITDSKLQEGLYDELGININQLKQAIRQEITRGIASNMPFADIARNIANRSKAPMSRAKTIVRTEGHRIQQASAEDARQAAKDRGCDVVRQWDSTLDGDTRSTHRQLDGKIVELEEYFILSSTKKARYPGDFGKPEEDCNCRCVALTRAKWALDEDELKQLKERAAYWKLDKKDDFADFEKKYLKAAEKADEEPPVTIAGLQCAVSKEQFGFNDGSGGTKKQAKAVIYETPDGTKFVFPEKYNKRQQHMTPEQAITLWAKVPENIRKKAQKTIQFVDYYNPQDAKWRKRYKNFTQSYATGGDTITFWRYNYDHDEDYVVRTYCHEAGHFIDKSNASYFDRYSKDAHWSKAMIDDILVSGKKSCTPYGENNNVEDFAESVAEYVKDRASFKKDFPNRTAILDVLLK